MTDKRTHLLATAPTTLDPSTAKMLVSDPAAGVDVQVPYRWVEGGINVLRFGADPTGAVESATAIQNAIDAAAARNGGTVYVPAGVYKVSTTLTIDSNVTLIGEGRGAEGDADGGAVFSWAGATSQNILELNSGAGTATHGWLVYNVGFKGNSVVGVNGVSIGSPTGSPKAAVGSLEKCWFHGFDGAGVLLKVCQLSSIRDCNFSTCTVGFHAAHGTDYANTTVQTENCRAVSCGTGFFLEDLTGSSFINCTAESCQEHGFYMEVGAPTSSVVNVSFRNCWCESNLLSGGTGRGYIETKSTDSSRHVGPIYIEDYHSGTPSAGNYGMVLSGCYAYVRNPWLITGQGILLKGSSASTASTVVRGTVDGLPEDYWAYQGGTGSVYATIQYEPKDAASAPSTVLYQASNSAPYRIQEVRKDRLIIADSAGRVDSTNKVARLGYPHYLAAEEDVCIVQTNSYSGNNILNIGGGTGVMNAQKEVNVFAAPNYNTTTGTKITATTTAGVDVVSGDLKINSSPIICRTTASPNGVKSAPQGSLAMADNGTGWLKQTGTGNTGWVQFPSAFAQVRRQINGWKFNLASQVIPAGGPGVTLFNSTTTSATPIRGDGTTCTLATTGHFNYDDVAGTYPEAHITLCLQVDEATALETVPLYPEKSLLGSSWVAADPGTLELVAEATGNGKRWFTWSWVEDGYPYLRFRTGFPTTNAVTISQASFVIEQGY